MLLPITALQQPLEGVDIVRLYLTAAVNWVDLPTAICRDPRLSEEGSDAQPRGSLMERLPEGLWSDQGLDGKYQFERAIAESAMAVVVVARHLQLDERVAIKFLAPDALRSSAAVSRFHREAKAAARIKNQHVVRIIDVASTAGGVPYIVMEFLDGHDLESLLKKYPKRQSPIADAVDFILQACEAVAEGHSLGIVHRDLKPANLFCVDRGDGYPMIKVLDFGISKFVASVGDVDKTDRHEILGSPRYMSPEQIESACSVDHRTDIWSLGVILYEAIAGQSPFNAELVPELWRKIRYTEPEPLPSVRRDCPPELWGVVKRCLEKAPLKRYLDLGELAQALAPLAPERSRASIARIRWTVEANSQSSTRPSAFSDSFERSTTLAGRSRSRWLIAGGLASTVGIGLSLAAMRRTSDPQPQAAHPRSETLLATPAESAPAGSAEAPQVTPVALSLVAKASSAGSIPSASRSPKTAPPRAPTKRTPPDTAQPPQSSASPATASPSTTASPPDKVIWQIPPELTRK